MNCPEATHPVAVSGAGDGAAEDHELVVLKEAGVSPIMKW
jgi:hypothetical protein